jgi:hypothetical protein
MFFHEPFVKAISHSAHDVSFFSSERRVDESGIIDFYYNSSLEANISNEVVFDVITRCRYLSGINLFDARLKVRKMWAAIEQYFDRHQVDLVLSSPVDNYVVDICFKIASDRKIPAFQPRQSPLPGLVRITNSIDNPFLREPDDEELNQALAHLGKSFKADYQNTAVRGTRQIAQKAVREVAKKIVFEYWKVKYSDKDSFHYNAIFPNKNAITIKSLSQLWFHKRFTCMAEDIKFIEHNYRKVVFWPLAMTPESALCYLNADSSFSDYRDVVGKVVDALPDDILLVVKEHPSAIGYRSVDQYSKLLSKNNIIICHAAESTGKLIDVADAVLINTSSTTGLESVALGKPVLALGSCHYAVGGVVDEINTLGDVYKWPELIRTAGLSQEEKESVIYKYLSNTIKNANWAITSIESSQYCEENCRTLEQCIDLVNNGYTPIYHGS